MPAVVFVSRGMHQEYRWSRDESEYCSLRCRLRLRLRLSPRHKIVSDTNNRAHERRPDGIYNIYTHRHHRDSWEMHIMLYKLLTRVVMQNRYLVSVLGVRLLSIALIIRFLYHSLCRFDSNVYPLTIFCRCHRITAST